LLISNRSEVFEDTIQKVTVGLSGRIRVINRGLRPDSQGLKVDRSRRLAYWVDGVIE